MNSQLSQSEFYILLSLAIKERHGYEIMKQVEQDSARKVKLGPGTLYGSIKRMLESKLIQEVAGPPASAMPKALRAGDNPRRKYYTLTEKGRKSLSSELTRYNDAVELAKQKNLFKDLGLVKLAL